VKNVGTATLQISNITVTPGQPHEDDFSFFSFCGRSLGAGKSCSVFVFFYADDTGQNTATLNFTDNAPGSPQQVALSGNVGNKH
jgi:hypothetical protein